MDWLNELDGAVMWGISGDVGVDARAELEEILKRQLVQQQFEEQKRQAKQRERMEEARLNETLRANAAHESRQGRMDKEADASAVADSLDARFDPRSPLDVELPESIAAALQGTRQGSRVQEIPTLSARATAGALGVVSQAPGIGVRRLAPTGEQQGQRRVVELRRRVSRDMQTAGDDNARRAIAASAFEEGLNIPQALMQPTLKERTAAEEAERKRDREEWQHRERFQDGLIRGRQPARGQVTAEDRAQALRDAKRDAIAYFNATKDNLTGHPTADLDALIQEYTQEYLEALQVIAESGVEPAAVLSPRDGTPATMHPAAIVQSMGAPRATSEGRRVVHGIGPRTQPPAAGSSGVTPSGNRSQPQPARSQSPTGGPAVGEQRMIRGVPARWDGRGWVPVS